MGSWKQSHPTNLDQLIQSFKGQCINMIVRLTLFHNLLFSPFGFFRLMIFSIIIGKLILLQIFLLYFFLEWFIRCRIMYWFFNDYPGFSKTFLCLVLASFGVSNALLFYHEFSPIRIKTINFRESKDHINLIFDLILLIPQRNYLKFQLKLLIIIILLNNPNF